jgi:hypothetical protein
MFKFRQFGKVGAALDALVPKHKFLSYNVTNSDEKILVTLISGADKGSSVTLIPVSPTSAYFFNNDVIE